MNILIVDDDPGTLNALKAGLISHGFEVNVARNGREALKIIRTLRKAAVSVDVLLTDLKMPGISGLDLIRSAKEELPGLGAILMTAFGSESVSTEVEASHSIYLDKPFTPDRLLKAIEELELCRSLEPINQRIGY